MGHKKLTKAERETLLRGGFDLTEPSCVFIVGNDSGNVIPLTIVTIQEKSLDKACRKLYSYLREKFPVHFGDKYSFAMLEDDIAEGYIEGYAGVHTVVLK